MTMPTDLIDMAFFGGVTLIGYAHSGIFGAGIALVVSALAIAIALETL